jgi:hypothetical protein
MATLINNIQGNKTELKVGIIVLFADPKDADRPIRRKKKNGTVYFEPRRGNYRVHKVFANGNVTLTSPWGSRIQHKKVKASELTEATEQFYKTWRNSETYRCM